jgi:hypothetical protein
MRTGGQPVGPVGVAVVGYPPGGPREDDAVPILLDLVDRGVIRVLDVVGIEKRAGGTLRTLLAEDVDGDEFPDLVAFAGTTTGLLRDADLRAAADTIQHGGGALLIVYENRWAAPLVAALRRRDAALRRRDGEVVAFERIAQADVAEVLERLASEDPAA